LFGLLRFFIPHSFVELLLHLALFLKLVNDLQSQSLSFEQLQSTTVKLTGEIVESLDLPFQNLALLLELLFVILGLFQLILESVLLKVT
jgi:hypothetical protein